ncbi:hypothetical protein [Jiangella alkaliphila]|uniref:Uncharacterized protein n=1 Tax=Jiangella alkaliphila TaxID=419479 RepID=A0A1H2H1J1_9ACTN|nr:hypothetical protein [Jiangella alkaliphila]SDU25691.1 hypothetical protein SAMN04488563_0790 [Jiangella alkaliphila]
MGFTPRQIQAVADRLHHIATHAQRDSWTPARAHGAVNAALEQLGPAEPLDDVEAAFPPLRICYEAEFTQ